VLFSLAGTYYRIGWSMGRRIGAAQRKFWQQQSACRRGYCSRLLGPYPVAAQVQQPSKAAKAEEISVSTAPVTPAAPTAPVTPKATNKFESILTGVGKFIQGLINAEINIAIAEKPLIDQFLPANLSSAIDTAEQVALSTYLQIEAQEQAIGASTTPYVGKVAQVIALQGGALAKILASAGLESGQAALQTLVTGATGFTQIGKITVLTAPTTTTTTGA
jgi:hypothetical protein